MAVWSCICIRERNMGIFDWFRKKDKSEAKTAPETKSNSIVGQKFNPLQCVTCGSNQLKKIRQGEYICQHCGNRYLTDNQDMITEATEKELIYILSPPSIEIRTMQKTNLRFCWITKIKPGIT